MTKGILTSFLFFLFTLSSFSQKQTSKPAIAGEPVAADCKYAIKLNTARKVTYGPTVPPKGHGKVMDIKACDKQDVFTFQKERNSSWYSFTAYDDGDLVIEITSVNPRDDYDFMLYKWTDSCFCDNVKQGWLRPVRTNLSHTQSSMGVPMTGLSAQAMSELVPLGVGDEFSLSLPVKKGERYYLAVDNVHPKGAGHILDIYYLKEITAIGVVTDESKKPVQNATIWVENANGKIINTTQTDSEGKYWLSAKIRDDEFYSLLYTGDSSFIKCRQISQSEFAKTGYVQKDLKTTLPKLELGKKYILDGISYNKSSGRLHNASNPSLNALARLMMKYKSLKVQIEGHVNNPLVAANTGADKTLGQSRATEVYDFLLNKGIANTRIVPTSFGSLFMIYPKPRNPVEEDANNRIEIFFLPDK